MNAVEQIVARYAGEGFKLGGREFANERLRRDLQQTLRRNQVYFNVLFGLLTGLMVLIVALLVFFVREPKVAGGILAVSGVSLPFVIRVMLQMWQVKTQAEALITLSTHLEPAMVRSIVKVLAQNIQSPASRPFPAAAGRGAAS